MGFLGDDVQASWLLSKDAVACATAVTAAAQRGRGGAPGTIFLCSWLKQLALQAPALSFAWRLQRRRPLTDCQGGGYRPLRRLRPPSGRWRPPHARPRPKALRTHIACTRKLDNRAVHPPGKRHQGRGFGACGTSELAAPGPAAACSLLIVQVTRHKRVFTKRTRERVGRSAALVKQPPQGPQGPWMLHN